MKGVRLATGALLALGTLGILSSIAMQITIRRFESKAVMAQIVRTSDQAELFGDIGEAIGSPQEYVVEDPGAFLKNEAPGGIKLIDQKYLDEKKVYPLQLKTVKYLAGTASLASGLLGVAGMGGWWFLRRRIIRPAG